MFFASDSLASPSLIRICPENRQVEEARKSKPDAVSGNAYSAELHLSDVTSGHIYSVISSHDAVCHLLKPPGGGATLKQDLQYLPHRTEFKGIP